jgi:hypothetical protein
MIMQLLRLRTSAWLCVMACMGAISLFGAELNVNVNVLFKGDAKDVVSSGVQAQERRTTIFVIDRSGSMNEQDQPDGRTRWAALLDGVKADLAGLPDREAIGLIVFQTVVMPVQTFSDGFSKRGQEYLLLDGPGARAAVLKCIADNPPQKGRSGGQWIGATALYDALGAASELAMRLGDKGFTSVQIQIHSDGLNTSSKQFHSFEEVKKKYGIGWEQFQELKIVGHWLGEAGRTPPDMKEIFGTNVVGSVRLNLPKAQLKNPSVMEKQSVDLEVIVEAPRNLWGEVENKDAKLTLQLAGYGSVDKTFPLTTGKQACLFALPDDLPKDRETSGSLRVSGLPKSPKLSLPDPNRAVVVFEQPGSVYLHLLQPRGDLRVLKGDSVQFKVTGTPDAVFKWQFNGADGELGTTVSKKLNETMTYVVMATKPGLIEARATGVVDVVDANIELQAPERNPRVGEPVMFRAVTRGTAGAIQWYVDDHPYVDGGAIQEIVFKQAGQHTVKAEAEVLKVRRIIAEFTLPVAPAPIIEIAELDDTIFNAKSNIAFQARVSGFNEITWYFTGAEAKTNTTQIKENAAALHLSFAKGGHYTVSASGVVDGKTLTSNTRTFDIRPEDMWVKILEPLEHEFIVDKTVGNACTFIAQVKGDDIVKIKWSVKNAETGVSIFEDDVRDIDGGKSSATWIFTPAQAGSVNVEAQAVFKSEVGENGALIAGNRTIWVRPVGSVSIASPAKNTLLPFGTTQAFEASVSGAVDPKAVSWYARDNLGKWQPLPNAGGIRYSYTFDHTGKSYDFVDLRVAAAGDPESQWRDEIRIRLECPQLHPSILLPKTNEVTRKQYGLHEKITFGFVATGKVSRVDWTFGDDNVTNAAAGVVHAYTNYGRFQVMARAQCSLCKGVESVGDEVYIVKTPSVPKFAILPEKETFSVGGKLKLVDESEGDVARLTWVTNGVEVAGLRGDALEISLPGRPAELIFGLRVSSEDGEMSPMYVRNVRVRYGWWAVVPILLAALFVWWLLFRLLTGNEPRSWTVYAWDGAVPKLVKGGYPEERNHAGKGMPSPLKRHWSWLAKKARIPIGALLGLSEDGEGSGGGWSLASREDRFVFRADGGKPVVACPNTVNEVSGTVGDRDVDHYFLFRDAAGTIGVDREFVRVVVEEGPSGWFCPVVLVLSTFAIIGTVFWLCLKYAV